MNQPFSTKSRRLTIPLAEIGKGLGRKYLAEVACVAKPATILAWYRRLMAQKFDGSKRRSYPRVAPYGTLLWRQRVCHCMARSLADASNNRIVNGRSFRVQDGTFWYLLSMGKAYRKHRLPCYSSGVF
jgi:hypothetical protein